MTDLGPFTIGAEPIDQPDAHPVGERIDQRDAPAPSPNPLDTYAEPDEHEAHLPKSVPVHILQPMPTRPAPARILSATSYRLDTSDGPRLFGLEPSKVQTQTIYRLLVSVSTGAIQVASDEAASESNRFTIYASEHPVVIEGVAGLYVWPSQDDTDVSVAVIGAAR